MTRIALITSYAGEDIDIIERCHKSITKQTVPCAHIIVSDGYEMNFTMMWNCQIIQTSHRHANYGDTPKWIGVMSALAQGFDYIGFVDADDWVSEDHVELLLKLMKWSKIDIAVASRNLVTPKGKNINIPEGPDEWQNHCVLMKRDAAVKLLSLGAKDQKTSKVGDRVMYMVCDKNKITYGRSFNRTYNYTTFWKQHYIVAGLTPPLNAKESL